MSNSSRCAACKYLRRRCPKDCIFGPYFPSSNIERFACVHKIFGASNVAKMLKDLPEERRREAAESLVMEARFRVRNPVYGSVGIINQLRLQIMEAEYELARTQGLLALYHAQAQYVHNHQNNILQPIEAITFTPQNQDDHSLLLGPQQEQCTSSSFINGLTTYEPFMYN
ncbi:unnamed protein product [Amaranthus hypochondriacus]